MSMISKNNPRPAVKHVVRQLAPISSPKGYRTVEEVDRDISSLVVQGYRLISTHFLGAQRDPENGVEYYGVLYVLQLEAGEIEKLKRAVPAEENG